MKMIKKIVRIFYVLVLAFIMTIKVDAMGYKFRDLIPANKTVTLRGDVFSYKEMRIEKNELTFSSIKNISQENHAITISIGFFDENKENIGIINYCSTSDALEPQRESFNYSIKIDSDKLADKKTIKDIKYISILSENASCRLGGSKEYIGKKIEDIKVIRKRGITDSAALLINILKIIAIILFILFIYKFLFTSAYQNMDGDDTRRYYKYKTMKNKKNNKNKPSNNTEKLVKNKKTEDIIKQEQYENKKENKEGSDLHKLYKD